jgi:tripartite-type tricarboxylate transporter receptor subunit TctC
VTTSVRSELLPDVPIVSDFLPGYEATAAPGIGVPKNTPIEIVNKLNREINAGLANSVIKPRLAGLGVMAVPGSPSDFGKMMRMMLYEAAQSMLVVSTKWSWLRRGH